MKSFIAVGLEAKRCKSIAEGIYKKICFLYYSMKTVGLGQRVLPDIKGTNSLDSSGLENLKNLEMAVIVFLSVTEINV